jgi:hypothetical protein
VFPVATAGRICWVVPATTDVSVVGALSCVARSSPVCDGALAVLIRLKQILMPRFSKRMFLSAVLAATTGFANSASSAEAGGLAGITDAAVPCSVEHAFERTDSLSDGVTQAGARGDAGGGIFDFPGDGCQAGPGWLQNVLDKPLAGDSRNVAVTDCLTASVGGEIRYRYMDESNRLRPGGPGESTYDLWRITPFMELKYGDTLTGYVQAIDASIFNHELPVTAIDENRADLLQYYLDANVTEVGDGTLSVRVGRQFLQYGSQHLVSPLSWGNTYRNFEGIKLAYSSERWDIDGFWTRPVNGAAGNIFRPTEFDTPDASQTFSGVYSTYKGLPNATIDLYWLFLDENNDNPAGLDGQRHTVGGRFERKFIRTDACGNTIGIVAFEVEGALQAGHHEFFQAGVDERIWAGMCHTKLAWTMNQVVWAPTITGLFYWASGDSAPGDGENNNFSTLYPLGHAYWGIIDNLNGSNLFNYSVQASVKPMDSLTLLAAAHWFFQHETASPIFNVAGAPVAQSGTNSAIGSELDLIATWQVAKTLQVQAGYQWFWYGDAVNAGPAARDDADQFYLMTTWSF